MSDVKNKRDSLRVTRVTELDFRRVEAIDIAPGRQTLIVLRGPNGHGKTSAMSGLIAALGGKRFDPDVPVRKGSESATVQLQLSDELQPRYDIKLGYADGKRYLHLRDLTTDPPSRVAKPQTVLSALVGDLSFDPLEFIRAGKADRKKQATMLLSAAGRLDEFDKISQQRAAAFDHRTEANRAYKAAQASLSNTSDPSPGKSLSPRSTKVLAEKLVHAQQHNKAEEDANSKAIQAKRELDTAAEQVAKLLAAISVAEQQLQEADTKYARLQADAVAIKPIATDELLAQIAYAGDHNRQCDQQVAHSKAIEDVESAKALVENVGAELAAFDAKVKALLAGSSLATIVPGLQIDQDGTVAIDGIPITEESGANALIASCTVGMAANPALRIMCIDEGDKLDDESINALIEIAKKNDYSVWMTAIRGGDSSNPDTTIYEINSGRLASSDITTARADKSERNETGQQRAEEQNPPPAAVLAGPDFDDI